ncbi:hypothetical protein N9E56_01480 [Flavobacteriaceae bacterium]|nr:hypothetical protein [Flavobacteriaceae bacterium]
MKNIISLIILSITILSCSQASKSNLELINYIDLIKNEKTIYEFQVDSLETIIDTLSIEKNKVDKNNVIVFKETKTLRSNGYLKSTNYYRVNNNLFYSKVEISELGILSTSEFWEKENKIIKGLYIEYVDNKVKDTIDIGYKYYYDKNGFKNKTVISSKYKEEIGNTTELIYNDSGKLIEEIFIQYGDTLRMTRYTYLNDSLRKKIIENYENSTFINFLYDKKENILSMDIFEKKDSLVRINETKYETNQEGEISRIVQTDYPSKNKKYVLYRKLE